MADTIAEEYDVAVGTVGYVIHITMQDEDGDAINVSSATTKQILIRRPDGSLLTKTAAYGSVLNGTDGTIQWTTVSGDLNTEGDYLCEGYVLKSSIEYITVHKLKIKVGPRV